MNTIEYGPIEAGKNGKVVQQLVLQDVELGRFPNPTGIANPRSRGLVRTQNKKIRAAADNYVGAYVDDELEGFMKIAPWMLADQLPFAQESERDDLIELYEAGARLDPTLKLGIFGLVVSNRLDQEVQAKIAENLLDIATDRALQLGNHAVNIVFHQYDPMQPVALRDGFLFTGRAGEAAGAPGLQQRLYSKPLDL